MVGRRIAAFLLALIVPPLGVVLAYGVGRAFLINLVLAVVAGAVFFAFMAIAGLFLWGCSILHAFISIGLKPKIGA